MGKIYSKETFLKFKELEKELDVVDREFGVNSNKLPNTYEEYLSEKETK